MTARAMRFEYSLGHLTHRGAAVHDSPTWRPSSRCRAALCWDCATDHTITTAQRFLVATLGLRMSTSVHASARSGSATRGLIDLPGRHIRWLPIARLTSRIRRTTRYDSGRNRPRRVRIVNRRVSVTAGNPYGNEH